MMAMKNCITMIGEKKIQCGQQELSENRAEFLYLRRGKVAAGN